MRILLTKVEMAENRDHGEMYNLASDRQIKYYKELLAKKNRSY